MSHPFRQLSFTLPPSRSAAILGAELSTIYIGIAIIWQQLTTRGEAVRLLELGLERKNVIFRTLLNSIWPEEEKLAEDDILTQ